MTKIWVLSYDKDNKQILGSDGTMICELKTLRGAINRAIKVRWRDHAVKLTFHRVSERDKYNNEANCWKKPIKTLNRFGNNWTNSFYWC